MILTTVLFSAAAEGPAADDPAAVDPAAEDATAEDPAAELPWEAVPPQPSRIVMKVNEHANTNDNTFRFITSLLPAVASLIITFS